MMRERKIAIVCSQGGMRCAYAAGALVALAKEFNLTSPNIMIATSGSAGSAFYYLTKQYAGLKRIWTELLSTPKFISFFRPWRIMDIDYLIDTVFKQQEPFDIVKLQEVTTEYYIPVTESETKKIRYISKKDHVDPFELLRATKALPIFYGKEVHINGVAYIDGGLVETFEDNILAAKELEATDIIAIGSHPMSSATNFLTKIIKKLALPSIKTEDIPTEEVNLILVTKKNIPAGLLTRNSEKLSRTFDMGYEDIVKNKELRRLFLR